jgi:hypothetical protein
MVSIAQTGDVVSISDAALYPGDDITIPIMIHDVTGVAAVGVNLSYYPRVVNITDAHQGDFTGFCNGQSDQEHADIVALWGMTTPCFRVLRAVAHPSDHYRFYRILWV